MKRTQTLDNVSTKLQRIAELARTAPQMAIRTLAHHIDVEFLRVAYDRTRKDGAVGVDDQTAADYAAHLESNLQGLLDRFKSGTYRAPPVRRVEIPKGDGTTRPIGIPTFEDKVLQRAVVMVLNAVYEQDFLDCSYGFRPGRSAHQAIESLWKGVTGMKGGWVIDLDIQKFFDTVAWDLVVKAVEANTDLPWVVLYVRRWLEAPVQQADGTMLVRDRGTPQGSAVSPVLANLFLHYAFDAWMVREFPGVQFERYVDDAVVHCVSERQARTVLAAISARMEQVGLRLHPDKTRIVYCQDGGRRASYEHTEFTFLGFTFRQRRARAKDGRRFNSFLPAISKNALKKISAEVQSWRLYNRTGQDLIDVARFINPIVRGWMQYYGKFYRSMMYPPLSRINAYLVRWIRKKYKRLRAKRKAFRCWRGIVERFPRMFAHWVWVPSVPSVW